MIINIIKIDLHHHRHHDHHLNRLHGHRHHHCDINRHRDYCPLKCLWYGAIMLVHRFPPSNAWVTQEMLMQHYYAFKVPFIYGEKLSRVEPPRFTCRNQKQKVGSARGLTRLAGSPFCDGRVTLLAGPTFLHINTLARPAGSPRSRRTQRMRERLREHWFTQSERSLLARAKG